MTVMETMRLGVCGACENTRAKYKCPKCKFTSCSLKCVKAHKLESGCDGIRNKTSYIAKDKIAELDVLSDYRLLESTSRCIDSYSRDEIKKSTRKFRDPHALPLPPHLVKFRNACFRREKCRLHFLPKKFQRHQDNTSRFIWKKNEIFWRVQLSLPHAYNVSYQKQVLDNISENTILYNLLQPYVIGTCNSRNENVDQNLCNDMDPYEIYRAAGFSGVKVLLKSEGDFHQSKRYHELDISNSLKGNLSGKCIVEHPILMIILNHHSDSFNLCEESDEDADVDKDNLNDINDIHASNSAKNDATVTDIESTSSDVLLNKMSAQQAIQNQEILASIEEQKNLPCTSEILAHPTTKREAEFNKNCYDFYLNYYSEKYGINNMQSVNITSGVSHVQGVRTNIPINKTRFSTNTNVPSLTSIQTRNTYSAQSLVAQQLIGNSENKASDKKVNVNECQSNNSKEPEVKIKPNHSLSLLAVYSDSEEEMDV